MVTNPYFLRARLFPTVLTSIPLLILITKIIAPLYNQALQNIYDVLPLITNIGLSAAVIFLSVQINRFISKEIFQRWFFQDELRMPTTTRLLWVDSVYEDETKIQLRSKIKDKFGIDLLDKTGEQANELKARKLIVTAVSQIRNLLRGNDMLFQHNIEYGFFRNLVGGSLLATVISLIILIHSLVTKVPSMTVTAIALTVIYITPLLLSGMIIKKYGNYYSKILYEQFLTV